MVINLIRPILFKIILLQDSKEGTSFMLLILTKIFNLIDLLKLKVVKNLILFKEDRLLAALILLTPILP